MILVPNSDAGVYFGSGWSWSGGSSFWDVLDSDDGDTSYAVNDGTDDGALDIDGFRAPQVKAADIASITSVQYTTSGKRTGRTRLSGRCDFAPPEARQTGRDVKGFKAFKTFNISTGRDVKSFKGFKNL